MTTTAHAYEPSLTRRPGDCDRCGLYREHPNHRADAIALVQELEADAAHQRLRDRLDDARSSVVAWSGVLVENREAGDPWDFAYSELVKALAAEKVASDAWGASLDARLRTFRVAERVGPTN